MRLTHPKLTHLQALEAEAIHVMREVAAELERPVLLFSGGKDSIVLLRLAEEAFRPARFPFPLMHVDTGHNFPEVLEFITRRTAEIGERLITAKVAALERALSGADAWITGIRREQAATRANAQFVEFDDKRSMWKYNPLADWTERDLWKRIHERDLPYHPLHDQGYASIGCAPCTQPGTGRDGRWAGTDKVECGLHVA